jgi:hypothetical protein
MERLRKLRKEARGIVEKVSKKKKEIKDPLESILDHMGKWLENAKPNDIVDIALYGGLAYLSLVALSEKETLPSGERVIKAYHPQDVLYGPIALKLATTMGGTPPVSQSAGLLALASLGLMYSGWIQVPKDLQEAGAKMIGSKASPFPFETERIWMFHI